LEQLATHPNLYETVLSRRSVRRYDKEPLDESTLDLVRRIIADAQPLVPENRFHVLLYDAPSGVDLTQELGGYGRIVNPPHYMLPYVLGQEHQLVDAGYRVQQIAVGLASLGIGSCFIGALTREARVRSRYELPDGSRIGAFLVFGRPSANLGGRATNQLLRVVAGANRKHSAREIFFAGSLENPSDPPRPLAPLIEAARQAPSAVNAQPWRFLWAEERLHVFVTRNNRRYRGGAQEHYCFHDTGAAMANVSLAMEALGIKGQWRLLAGKGPHIPEHPPHLLPVATLVIEGGG
jgi:nitroreductase